MVARGQLWWADLGEPVGSAPGYRRPVAVVSSDRFNQSRLATVVVAAVTSNLRLATAPGNVALLDGQLPKPSVINVTQLLTLDRQVLESPISTLAALERSALDEGLRLVLEL